MGTRLGQLLYLTWLAPRCQSRVRDHQGVAFHFHDDARRIAAVVAVVGNRRPADRHFVATRPAPAGFSTLPGWPRDRNSVIGVFLAPPESSASLGVSATSLVQLSAGLSGLPRAERKLRGPPGEGKSARVAARLHGAGREPTPAGPGPAWGGHLRSGGRQARSGGRRGKPRGARSVLGRRGPHLRAAVPPAAGGVRLCAASRRRSPIRDDHARSAGGPSVPECLSWMTSRAPG